MKYNIAGEIVNYSSVHIEIRKRFRDFEIHCSNTKNEIDFDFIGFLKFKDKNNHLSEIQCELIYSLQLFFVSLIKRQKLIVHATSVVVGKTCYVFIGKNNVGKSTIANQIINYFGKTSFVLNDDRTVMGKIGGNLVAWRTPWSKISFGDSTKAYGVGGVIVMSQGREQGIEGLSLNTMTEYLCEMYPLSCRNDIIELTHFLLADTKLWIIKNNMTDYNVEGLYEVFST